MKEIFVTTKTRLNMLMQDFASAPQYVAFDTETTGLHPYQEDEIIGYCFYFPHSDNGYYVPVYHQKGDDPDNLPKDCLDTKIFKEALETLVWVGYNTKFDLHFMLKSGHRIHKAEDVQTGAHLASENEKKQNGVSIGAGSYKLKDLARHYLGEDMGAGEDDLFAQLKEMGVGKDAKGQMWRLPAKSVAYYAIMDAYITWELRKFVLKRLEAWDQVELYHQRNHTMMVGYFPMERNGLKVDLNLIKKLSAENTTKLEASLLEITALLNYKINPNSPAQVKAAFHGLGLDIPNTTKAVLEGVATVGGRAGALAQLILDVRVLSKAESNYYVPYAKRADDEGRVHCSLNMAGTRTGRLSAYDPNPQQLPKKSDKYPVKKVFVPDDGWVIAQFDYKNLEAYVAANVVQEPTFIEMFRSGGDLHQHTANRLTELLGRPVSRAVGKNTNFSLFYGMGVDKVMIKFGVGREEAIELLKWHELYPRMKAGYNAARRLATTWRPISNTNPELAQYIRLPNGRTRKFSEFVDAWTGEDGNYVVGAKISVELKGQFHWWVGSILSVDTVARRYTCFVYPRTDKKKGETLHLKFEDVSLRIDYHNSFSSLIQGTAAHVNETAVTVLGDTYDQYDPNCPVRLCLPVHDSIIPLIKVEAFDEVAPHIKYLMETCVPHDPPFKVEVEASTISWYDMFGFEVDGKPVPITMEELYKHEKSRN